MRMSSNKRPPPPTERPATAAPAAGAAIDLQTALDRAVALAKKRKWREAEPMIRAVLARKPDHFDALHMLGRLYLQTGRPKDGVVVIERALALRPDRADVHFSLGNGLTALGKWDSAVAAYRRAIEIDPGHAHAHNRLGLVLASLGRLDEAAACYRRAAEIEPDLADAYNNLGNILRHQGRFDEAAAAYRRVIDIDSGYETAHNNLGMALSGLGRIEEAIACFRRALEINPRFAKAHNNLAGALRDGGDLDEAIAHYRQAADLDPDSAEAFNNLGIVLEARGRTDEAIAAYRRAIAIKPDYAAAHNNVGNALRAREKLDEAIASFRRALEIAPEMAVAHNNLGIALRTQEKIDEAIASYRRALEIDPGYAEAHNNLGNIFKDLGRNDEAVACYDRAIEIRPDFAEAHFNRAKLHTFYAGDPALEKLKEFHERGDVPEEHKSNLFYSLGKAHDESGLYDEAFEFYRRANEEKGKEHAFDPRNHRRGRNEVINAFREPRPVSGARSEGEHPIPIFVVGMSRSGKTLVESLLAQHPDVHGAGETHHWTEAMQAVLAESAITVPYPHCLPSLGSDAIAGMGRGYLRAISERAPGSRYVVDTMPANYPFVGLIREAIPEARLVFCRRDPLDHCLFVYFYAYRTGNGYSYDLDHVASYYADYHRLLDHWQRLYGNHIHSVRYEELVRDPLGVAAGLYAHCGLDYDPAAIEADFTTDEIGHWRHYERHLGPLRKALTPWLGPGEDDATRRVPQGRQ